MLNVLPPYVDSNVEIISKKGIITIFSIFILVVVVIALAYRFNQIHRTTDKEDLLELAFTIVCVNFIIFSLYKVGYGNHIFEERYLISTYLFVILIVGAYISRLNIAQVFSKMVILILLLGVIGTNNFSDYIYLNSTNDSWNMEIIKETAEENSTDLIYFGGKEINGAGRAIRAYDLEHIYKQINEDGKYVHFGDYLDYENNSDYNGATSLVVNKNDNCVPEEIMNQYTLEKVLDGDIFINAIITQFLYANDAILE